MVILLEREGEFLILINVQQHAPRLLEREAKRYAVEKPWIGPGHETASSSAREIESSVAGRADGGAGYCSGAPGAVSSRAGSRRSSEIRMSVL
jgi:hypothetical protein